MTLYDVFAVTIVLCGLGSFGFLLSRAVANWQHPSVFVNLLVLALCGLYLAGVYASMGFGMQIEKMTIGVYVRPVLILYLLVPSLIVYRLKV